MKSQNPDWQRKRIRDLCELGRGRMISAVEIQKNPGIYPVFSSQSSNNGQMGAIDSYDFDGEYVTWTTDGAYAGTVFYRTGKFNCTNVCGTLSRHDLVLDMQFLAYLLGTVAKDHVSYVGNPKLMNGVVADIEIDLPIDGAEQSKIAEILSTVDRAIEQTEALIAKQQRIKSGLMQDLLTRGIDEQGNLRSEQTHQFKDSPLGRIPEEWECGNVLAFASRKRQPILTGPFGSSLGTDDFVDYGVPVLRIGNVQAGFMELSDLNYVTEEKAMELSRYRVQEGDLLFARSGATTGRNALADHRCSEVLINYHIIRVATDKDRCDPTFLYSLFNSDLVRRQVDQEKGKSTREGVNTATILSLALLIPSVNEQRRIGQLIRSVDNQIETLKRQHEKARQVKTALMQDLLTGEKRVTPLLDADVTEDAVHA